MARDDRTVGEIERDLERERDRLGRTLEDLSTRFSVESLTGEAAEQLKGMGSDALRGATDRLTTNARAHPAAVAIAGAGLLWLILSPEKSAPTPVMPSLGPTDDGHMSPPSRPPAPQEAPMPMPARIKEAGAEALKSVGNEAVDLRTRISEGTETLTAEGRKRVVAAREAAVEAVDVAIKGTKSKARDAANSIEDNPWVFGGVALALGAAIGGAMLYRKSEEEARSERNALFAEADRILREETERSAMNRDAAAAGLGPDNGAGR